jgi:hypothetical protein
MPEAQTVRLIATAVEPGGGVMMVKLLFAIVLVVPAVWAAGLLPWPPPAVDPENKAERASNEDEKTGSASLRRIGEPTVNAIPRTVPVPAPAPAIWAPRLNSAPPQPEQEKPTRPPLGPKLVWKSGEEPWRGASYQRGPAL